jgi:voltage-gated potassium channel
MNEVKKRVKAFVVVFLLITAVGTFGFMKLESLAFTDALYFNLVTMSTVGYGDIYPHTPLGRMFAVLIILAGGAAFLGVIANATELVILKRDSYNRMRKVNMVLGVFFSEVGNHLLALFSRHHKAIHRIRDSLRVKPGWAREQFSDARKQAATAKLEVDPGDMNLSELNLFLKSKRDFLVGLLENPVLVEHEGFSECLLAVFHLHDELSCRKDLIKLPNADHLHLVNDMNRAYGQLVDQWLVFLEHLQSQYPYIFSLSVRNNPFDPEADPVLPG